MSRLLQLARENGWPSTLTRTARALQRRLRDSFTSRHLGSPGFRAGRSPRLLGLSHARIAPGFTAGDDLWLEAITSYRGTAHKPQLTIGPNCALSDRVHIACLGSVTIGANFLSGSGVLISDHGHGAYRGPAQSAPDTAPIARPLYAPAPIVIGDNVWLGDSVTILAGAHIGNGAVIGAGSLVTGAIPANTIAAGCPAKPIRQWNAATQQWQRIETVD